MRIATWNVNSLKIRLPRVIEWIEYARPDVLCIQETKMADAVFPAMDFSALGYESAHCGDGRWNGVAILSRVGLDDVANGWAEPPPPEVAQAAELASILAEPRLISATCGGIRISSVYVPNGREVGSDHYRAKLAWLAHLRRHLEKIADPRAPVVVAGDFNVAPEDRDVWDMAQFAGATHVSQDERDGIVALVDWGMVDVFRQIYDQDHLYSWWDYRAGAFHQHRGMRIDLILATRPVADGAVFGLIDRQARKGQQPSDHAPVLIDSVGVGHEGNR
ncbi:MAG: exodeoxyribonuclease III [Acidimicrobiales bacterium]